MDDIQTTDSMVREPASQAIVPLHNSSAENSITSSQVIETLRKNREEHRHTQIWTKDPHQGPYRKAKAGDGYDPLTQNPDGSNKQTELGYHHPVELGPTSNFVGNHMTQGAIDLVQAELGQKSSKLLRLKGAAATSRKAEVASTPKLIQSREDTDLIDNQEMEIKGTNSINPLNVGPIVATPGGRPPDLTDLRKALRQQRDSQRWLYRSDTLRGHLKELYKKVHPDYFHGDPTAKSANEKSFKLLQEYLSAAEQGTAGGGGAASLPYKFTFYVRKTVHHADGDTESKQLEKVSLALPPPNRSLRDTNQALKKLLSACGIEASSLLDSEGSHGDGSSTKLSHWLPDAAEQFHQSASQQGGPRQELQATRTALQLSRRISLVFGGDLLKKSILPQLEAARQLLAVLDRCPPEISGLKIGIAPSASDGYSLDSYSGTIWLHSGACSEAWLEYLNAPEVLEWHQQYHREIAALRDKERRAAKVLGVGLIVAQVEVHMSDYGALLQRICDLESSGPLPSAGHAFRKVSVLAIPSPDGKITSDGTGKILAPVSCSGLEVLGALKKLGPEAARCAEIAAKEQAELNSLRTQVERKLRLRVLRKHPDLPNYKFRAACLRMLQHSRALAPLVDNLPIRISEVNALLPGESHIDISWSFVI